jgi:hypothetical protein
MRLLLTLLRHRTTWRFLLVLAGAIGASLVTQQQLGGLETLVCSLLTCSD